MYHQSSIPIPHSPFPIPHSPALILHKSQSHRTNLHHKKTPPRALLWQQPTGFPKGAQTVMAVVAITENVSRLIKKLNSHSLFFNFSGKASTLCARKLYHSSMLPQSSISLWFFIYFKYKSIPQKLDSFLL